MIKKNPFHFGRMVTGNAFTGRNKEIHRLIGNFRNGINTILISPRRWGKSSLVKKVGEMIKSDDVKIVYIDVFSLRSEHDFYTAYAKAVISAASSYWEERFKSIKEFFRHITPKIRLALTLNMNFQLVLIGRSFGKIQTWIYQLQ